MGAATNGKGELRKTSCKFPDGVRGHQRSVEVGEEWARKWEGALPFLCKRGF
jgi:hypothetical protein